MRQYILTDTAAAALAAYEAGFRETSKGIVHEVQESYGADGQVKRLIIWVC